MLDMTGDAANPPEESGFTSRFFSAPDGLKLHMREYGPRHAPRLPVICLPGLARHAADFHDLALALSGNKRAPRRVLALDYRGRGLSDRDRNWRHYDIRVELMDTLAVLDAAGVERAVFVGTSRGGLITMAMSAARPAAIAGVVLNDIGPVIEAKGLMRIKGYVGKLPAPRDYREGGAILKRIMDAQFPRWGEDEWEDMARRTWSDSPRGLVPAYDPKLMKTLSAVDLETPLPPLWHLFDGLKHAPMLVLRGANSDILSPETVATMETRHPRLASHVVADQGHAPHLAGRGLLQLIARFVNEAEE